MKNGLKKIICLIISLLLLAGCSPVPFETASDIDNTISDAVDKGISYIGKLITAVSGQVTTVEQTEVVEFTLEFPKCYSKLDSTQKRMYRIMLTASESMVEGWISLGKCDDDFADDVALAYRALQCDRPEMFWMPSNYVISSQGVGSGMEALVAFKHSDGKTKYDYLVTKTERNRMRSELDAAVEVYLGELEGINDLFEKELYINDKLCNDTEYDKEGGDMIYTSYGALVDRRAVCEGYSRAIQLICDKIDIPCLLVYGNADGGGHMWNLINPGDGWYHLDATWNDNISLNHIYFNMTEEDISADHTIIETYFEINAQPSKSEICYNYFDFEAANTYFNFYEYQNLVIESGYQSAAESIYKAAQKGKKDAEFKITDPSLLARFTKDFNEPVAELQNKLNRLYGKKAPQLSAITLTGEYVILYW